MAIWAMLVEDVAQHPRFWDVSLANVITWLVLVVGFLGTHYVSVKLLTQRMNTFDEWRKTHTHESNQANGQRDELLKKLGETSVRLSVLSETTERRLQKIEDRPVYTRSDDPRPYYGAERRRK
jgi:hypothetical protein